MNWHDMSLAAWGEMRGSPHVAVPLGIVEARKERRGPIKKGQAP
jgi:hypothetical protein